jgi:hypothetical protein
VQYEYGLVWQDPQCFRVLKQKRCLFICRPFCALMGELDDGFVGPATSEILFQVLE